MFHNEEWLKTVRENKDSEVHSVEDGHWVMANNNKFIVELIIKRIKRINN